MTATTTRRKTVSVADLVATANRQLAHVEGDDIGGISIRQGIIGLLESVLHATGNYKGYSYLPSEIAEDGGLRYNYDATRRAYSV